MKESQKFNYRLTRKIQTLRSRGISDVFAEYRTTDDPLTFSRNYNISLNDDGTVFDKDSKMRYDTLSDWIQFSKRS